MIKDYKSLKKIKFNNKGILVIIIFYYEFLVFNCYN